MNITPQYNQLPLATVVNQPTDALRRDNIQREVITQPAPTNASSAEKGVASEKDKAKTPAQNNEQVDFAAIRKQAGLDKSTIAEENQQDSQNSKQENNSQQDGRPEKNSLEQFAEEQEILDLKLRDREVRTHELAHAAVGGAHTGAPSYTFEIGPDGKKYAVEGEVSVDLSPIAGDPKATITKLQKVRAAALAPADPSVQDSRVAAQAARLIAQAQSQVLAEKFEDPELVRSSPESIPNSSTFASNDNEQQQIERSKKQDVDYLINQTLKAQEQVAPSRPKEVDDRASRIESFYQKISLAYEKKSNSHFSLSA